MSEPVPEFSRRVPLDRIGSAAIAETIEADAGERAALAVRFGWSGIEALSAEMVLLERAGGVDVAGHLRASLTQFCVVTGDPVPAVVDQKFRVRFVDAAVLASGEEDEVELSESDLDVMAHDGGALDLGEAVAQTLALSVDPFPRAKAAAARLKEAGVVAEDEVEKGPFAGLKGLFGG
ncbi:DUF177 domain-containing protein [Sphingomonas sp.]|uniref:DUF177 domain-containing protein n=1 Tax=Sphingomonas sp. TaxID=28214 RepID=UPI0025FBBDCE|nr:DUF177 domain-containing protein [Sphingomonas sp.]